MKKIFYLASIAALAFSSCAKDETTEANLGTIDTGSKIVASMEADATRTELVKNGNAYDIVWKSSDALSVYESNAYGTATTAFHNRMFQMDNASDGLATGAFKGSALNANGTYVAVYPYNKAVGDAMTPNWAAEYYTDNYYNKYTMLDPAQIKVTIPAEQEYVASGTFNTNTIPAVSTEFVVGADGNATVKMQPVVDYVMVDIAATESINSISLELYDGGWSTTNKVAIAGTTALEAYYANGGIRYVTENSDLTESKITLVTKDLADDVSLAKANTYVFAIPGGILGMGNSDLKWMLSIDGVEWLSSDADYNKTYFDIAKANNGYINGNLNAYNSKGHNRTTGSKAHKVGSYTTTINEYAMNLENTVFYLNKSKDGQVLPFTYNPNNDALIQNELDLLEYIVNYESTQNDAYVAEDAKFNFSVDHMSEILRHKDDIEASLRTVINNYIMPDGSFPVIEEYANQFRGNNAVISNIERPLAEMTGLFGKIEGTSTAKAYVRDITLANVVAATEKVDGEIIKGDALASEIGDYAAIVNITVADLNADAVVGVTNDANYKQIKIGEAGVDKDLNHIVDVLTMNGDLAFSAEDWAAKSAVAESVFHTVIPGNGDGNLYNNTTYNDKHQLAILPETAEYSKFVEEVDYENVAANTVVSVMIGNVSYWTGGKINTAAPAAYTTKPVLVQFAEQLAYGEVDTYAAVAHKLTRSMNFENVDWTETVEYTTLDGGNNTVTGLTYVVNEDNWANNVAPFDLTNVSNIVFDGLTIDIETTSTNKVPRLISGLSNRLTKVDGVTINNLVIDAYTLGSNNTVTDPVYDETSSAQRHIGWLSAEAVDIAVYDTTVNGVDSNVIGLSAMVSWINVKTNNSIFDGATVTGKVVKAKAQTDIKEFTRANTADIQYNLMGSLVGWIENAETSATNVGVKFNNFGSVKPVSLYSVNTLGSAINVLYNNKLAVSLYHADDDRNE